MDRSLAACRSHIAETTIIKEAHFLERVDASFCIQTSILPKLTEFARLKISGELPRLHLNLMDSKYTVIKRVLTNAIPSLEQSLQSPISDHRLKTSGRQMVTDDGSIPLPTRSDDLTSSGEENFQDAAEELKPVVDQFSGSQTSLGSVEQVTLDLQFSVTEASITLMAEQPGLSNALILSDLVLKSLSMNAQTRRFDSAFEGKVKSIQLFDKLSKNDFIFSPTDFLSDSGHLLACSYKSMEENSPYFDGTNDYLNLDIASMTWNIAAMPILKVYDFFLSTFNGSDMSQPSLPEHDTTSDTLSAKSTVAARKSTSQINLSKMTILFLDSACIATANFETMTLIMTKTADSQNTRGTIGKLSVTDNLSSEPMFQQILKVSGDRVIDFTLDTMPTINKGQDSSLSLSTASIQILYNPAFISRFSNYLANFQKMYSLMESARASAMNSATQISQSSDRFTYSVIIQTPIITIPRSGFSEDTEADMFLYLYPGTLHLRNGIGDEIDDMMISLSDMRVTTCDIVAQDLDVPREVVEKASVSVVIHDGKAVEEGPDSLVLVLCNIDSIR